MAASHKLAMKLVTQINDQMAPADAGRLTNAAARIMLAFQSGVLTLHKIRTGGKQVVVVQHVDVSSGGQAVVAGSMNAGVKRIDGKMSSKKIRGTSDRRRHGWLNNNNAVGDFSKA